MVLGVMEGLTRWRWAAEEEGVGSSARVGEEGEGGRAEGGGERWVKGAGVVVGVLSDGEESFGVGVNGKGATARVRSGGAARPAGDGRAGE